MANLANLGLPYPTDLDPATADLWGSILNTIFIAFDAEFAVKTINQSFADKVISRPELKDYAETLVTATSTAGTATLDFSAGNHQQITLSENTTIAFSNFPSTGRSGGMLIYVKQHASAAKTLAWPASVKWAGGTAPVMTPTVGRTDIYLVITRDGGTSYIGAVTGQNYNI